MQKSSFERDQRKDAGKTKRSMAFRLRWRNMPAPIRSGSLLKTRYTAARSNGISASGGSAMGF
jgi:hypothetical protein